MEPIVDKLVRQKPADRYVSIDELKKDLIAQRQVFISRQAVNELSKKVVPIYEPGQVVPVEVIGVDWDSGVLTLNLSRSPEGGWVQRLHNPTSSYTMMMGAEPRRFSFHNDRAHIPADPRSAQAVIDQFKKFSDMATLGYQADLRREADVRQSEERRQLEEQRKAAEQRASLLKTLKY